MSPHSLSDSITRFLVSEDGGVAIEYALIAGIVSISIVAALYSVRSTLTDVFGDVNAGFQ